MQGVLHQILSGLATGGIYASVALALVMIYQATHHVNFAQGEMATLSDLHRLHDGHGRLVLLGVVRRHGGGLLRAWAW